MKIIKIYFSALILGALCWSASSDARNSTIQERLASKIPPLSEGIDSFTVPEYVNYGNSSRHYKFNVQWEHVFQAKHYELAYRSNTADGGVTDFMYFNQAIEISDQVDENVSFEVDMTLPDYQSQLQLAVRACRSADDCSEWRRSNIIDLQKPGPVKNYCYAECGLYRLAPGDISPVCLPSCSSDPIIKLPPGAKIEIGKGGSGGQEDILLITFETALKAGEYYVVEYRGHLEEPKDWTVYLNEADSHKLTTNPVRIRMAYLPETFRIRAKICREVSTGSGTQEECSQYWVSNWVSLDANEEYEPFFNAWGNLQDQVTPPANRSALINITSTVYNAMSAVCDAVDNAPLSIYHPSTIKVGQFASFSTNAPAGYNNYTKSRYKWSWLFSDNKMIWAAANNNSNASRSFSSTGTKSAISIVWGNQNENSVRPRDVESIYEILMSTRRFYRCEDPYSGGGGNVIPRNLDNEPRIYPDDPRIMFVQEEAVEALEDDGMICTQVGEFKGIDFIRQETAWSEDVKESLRQALGFTDAGVVSCAKKSFSVQAASPPPGGGGGGPGPVELCPYSFRDGSRNCSEIP